MGETSEKFWKVPSGPSVRNSRKLMENAGEIPERIPRRFPEVILGETTGEVHEAITLTELQVVRILRTRSSWKNSSKNT